MCLLKIVFVLFLLLFPLGELARFELGNSIAFTINDILLVIVISIFILNSVFTKNIQKNFNSPLLKPITIFVGIGLFSLVINSIYLKQAEFFTSFLYLLRWVLYAGVYFVVKSFDSHFRSKTSILLIIVGMIIVAGGYIQYFLYPALRNLIYLGWDEHLYRMFSSFLDPNFVGIFFVLYFLFILYFFFCNRIILLSLILITVLPAIFLTYSRSAILSLFIGVFTFLLLLKKRKILIIFSVILVIMLILSTQFLQSEGTNLFRKTSTQARIDSSIQAIEIIKNHPVLGVGFNAYRYAQYRYGFLGGEDWQKSHSGAGTDNSFLFVLATTGILGFIAYMFLWHKILEEMLNQVEHDRKNKRKQFQPTLNTVLLSSIVALFTSAFFINSLFYPFLMQWIWILVGLRENK